MGSDSLHLLPTHFPKKHLGCTRKRISGSGARSRDSAQNLSVGGGCSSTLLRCPGGYLGGERPRRVLVTFARTKVTPAERPQAGKPVPGNRRRTDPLRHRLTAAPPLPEGEAREYNNGLPWISTAGHEVVEAAPYHSARRICAQILHPDEARLRGNTLCIAAKPQRNLGGKFPQSLADAMVRCSLSASEGRKPQRCGGWARCRWRRCSHQPHPATRRG